MIRKKFSSSPSFIETGHFSAISEFAMPLVAVHQGEHFPFGTAVRVSPNLALASKHVFDEWWKSIEGGEMLSGDNNARFEVLAFQTFEDGTAQGWRVTKVWCLSPFDIVIMAIQPAVSKIERKRRGIHIDLAPPRIGSRVTGFGFHSQEIKIGEGPHPQWKSSPTTTVGEVIEVHHEYRDSVVMPYPCFQTNARFDGAMSGGPVFNEAGKLCGLITSTYEAGSEVEAHASYVATLWPMMGIHLDANRVGHPPDCEYPALELAKSGVFQADGYEKISIAQDGNGKVTQLQFGQWSALPLGSRGVE